jgi:Golgi phosphoprotein 3 (GPP34)
LTSQSWPSGRGHSAASKEYSSKRQFIDEVLAPFGARFFGSEPFRPVTIRAVYADDDTVIVIWDGRGITPGDGPEVMVGVMDPSVSGSAPAALGEDLFLLSIRRRDGKLVTRGRIDSALMASELIRLAVAGRAWMDEGRVVARDQAATGDPELDAALLSLAGATSPPRPETWVGLPRRGIRAAYAARLTSAGTLRLESSRVLGTPRYRLTDPARLAAARSRLDAVVQSAGAPADLVPLALAGLASTIGLGDVLYPGREGRASRARMARIARQQVITQARAGRGTGGGRVPPAGPVTGRASRDADGDGELTRESAGEGDRDPASLPALEEVIAATVHALTAVMEDGAIVASEVAGTRVGGIHIPGAHGAADHGGEGH